MAPAARNLTVNVKASSGKAHEPISSELEANVARVNKINYIATCLGVLLFLFMFFKPTL